MMNKLVKNIKRLLRESCIACCLTAISLAADAQQTYTLDQLKDSAYRNNAAMHQAQLNVDAAEQQRKEAFTKYFPNVSGTGAWFNTNHGMAKIELNAADYLPPSMMQLIGQILPPEALAALATPFGMSLMKNGTMAGITAMQPVFAGGQIINGNKLAKVGEEVSRLQLQLSQNEVEKTTELYFWQLLTLQEKQNTLYAVEQLLNDIHKDVEVAVKAGVILRNDLLQVQLRQNEVESQKLKLNNGLGLVKMLLAQYCGLNDTAFSIKAPADNGSEPVLVNHEQALSNTAEYQLLNKQVEAATLQKRMTVGQNLPTVAVGAGYNYHNMLQNDHTFGMVFATVSVPISDWWGGSHAIKRKKIELQKAIEQRDDNAALLKIRMQKAWNDVEEARQQIVIAQRSIEQAEENLRIQRNCYQAGTATMSTLLEAQLLYQQAHDQLTEAKAEYQKKQLDYRQATGE